MSRNFVASEFEHVTKCPDCKEFIFYNTNEVKPESIGGTIVRRTVLCNHCEKDITIYPWREL